MILQVLRQRVKKSSKMEFNHLLKGSFNGCIYQMVSRNSEWLNVQFGVNYVSLEMPSQEVNDDSQKVCIFFFFYIFLSTSRLLLLLLFFAASIYRCGFR